MRAVFVEHAEPALRVAEHHEAFAQQFHPHRRAVRFGDLFGKACRDPVAAHDLAHRRVALDAAQQVVFLRGHIPSRELFSGIGSSLKHDAEKWTPVSRLREALA